VDLDMAFYSQNPQLALTCGATLCGMLLLGKEFYWEEERFC